MNFNNSFTYTASNRAKTHC